MSTRGNYKLGEKGYRLLYDTRDPEKYILTRTRSNSKPRGLECTITIEDIYIPEFCPILNIKLDQVRSGSRYAPSLDHVDNTKGYIPGNVRVISRRANDLKGDLNLKEVLAIVTYLST